MPGLESQAHEEGWFFSPSRFIVNKGTIYKEALVLIAETRTEKTTYTYSDYLSWDDEFCELVDGMMVASPSPVTSHQRVCRNLFVRLDRFLEGKPGEVFFAPYSVRLDPRKDLSDRTVLVPDIIVVLDPEKIDERGCNGAPDFVAEVLSPSNINHDRVVKFDKYLRGGVREYWIIDPSARTVQACVLENDEYKITVYGESASVPVKVLPGCVIPLAEIFAY